MSNNTATLLDSTPQAAATESPAMAQVGGDRANSPATGANDGSHDLRPPLFGAFAELIEFLSPASVVRTAETECDMLERDLASGQAIPRDQTLSVISFCRFVRTLRQRPSVPPPYLSMITPEQLKFYRQTVVRLMQARQLPPTALLEFDFLFKSAPEPVSARVNGGVISPRVRTTTTVTA